MSRSLRYCYNEVAPFSALIIVQFTEVGVNILFKEATNKGLSYYVFIFYSFSISTLILLLPLPFISFRLNELPSFNFSLLCKVFSLGILVNTWMKHSKQLELHHVQEIYLQHAKYQKKTRTEVEGDEQRVASPVSFQKMKAAFIRNINVCTRGLVL
ncbi:hypothetical protein Lalb_Chr23g0276441 [Lupinus albus]|uniref:WAT1-related protein n=1 Tax=Lupinus albus TaxID=3870 RepID=A0A6A4NA08_LUPAL|nr:hypothetical protein Lalb_Chr23g0276441 [Lupinus albus]